MITLLGKYVATLYRNELKYINTVMKPYGLGYSSYYFLLYISKNEGTSQKALCGSLSLDEAMATRAMKRLEEEGFVLRKREAPNPHSNALYLTEKGWELVPKIKAALTELWSGLTETLSPEETDTLTELLHTLVKNASSQVLGKNEKEDSSHGQSQ